MAYLTPVYNRTLFDISAKNSKAFLNLADWQRIDNNTAEVVALILSVIGDTVSQVTVATMTTASIPSVDDINDLAGNIEALRSYIVTSYPASPPALAPEFTDVKDDYASGDNLTYTGYKYPFEVVNHWEQVIDIAYQWLANLDIVRFARSGVGISGAGLTRNNAFRG